MCNELWVSNFKWKANEIAFFLLGNNNDNHCNQWLNNEQKIGINVIDFLVSNK